MHVWCFFAFFAAIPSTIFCWLDFPYLSLADIRHAHISGYFQLKAGLHTRVLAVAMSGCT